MLRTALQKFPQATRALGVREKIPVESLKVLPGVIDSLERELGSSGRVLVRYSGTESKLRLLVEASSAEVVNLAMARLVAAASSELALT